MAESDGRNMRWNSLIHVAELIIEGKVKLEDLSKNVVENSDDFDYATRTIIKRGKRSPRRRRSIPNFPCRNPNFPCIKEKGPSPSPRKRTILRLPMPPEPTLPEAVKNEILRSGGCLESVLFLIEKTLSVTDLNRHDGRLSMPRLQVRNEFLQPNESKLLESNTVGFQTRLIQPCLEECNVTICLWKSNGVYVLKSGWNYVLDHNLLEHEKFDETTIVRVFSFRRKSKLCFALIKKFD